MQPQAPYGNPEQWVPQPGMVPQPGGTPAVPQQQQQSYAPPTATYGMPDPSAYYQMPAGAGSYAVPVQATMTGPHLSQPEKPRFTRNSQAALCPMCNAQVQTIVKYERHPIQYFSFVFAIPGLYFLILGLFECVIGTVFIFYFIFVFLGLFFQLIALFFFSIPLAFNHAKGYKYVVHSCPACHTKLGKWSVFGV